MTGARLLAPFFGTSNVVWANVIGLILIYLSLGYWLGGRLADRHPNERALGFVVLVAAVDARARCRSPPGRCSTPPPRPSTTSRPAPSSRSFVGTLLMFALPVTALGAVAPWAIRLAVHDVREAGTVAGRLYALSTLGSIVGTFLPVLCSSRRSARGARCSLPRRCSRSPRPCSLPRRDAAGPGAAGRRWCSAARARSRRRATAVLFEGESPYQFVQVVEAAGRRHACCT